MRVIRSAGQVEAVHVMGDAANQKAADCGVLREAAQGVGLRVAELVEGGGVEATVRPAIEEAGRNGEVVVVCGSFMVMHDAKQGMGLTTFPRDPILLR